MSVDVWTVKVVGVTHKNEDGSDRQEIIRKYAQPGLKIDLRHEPDNPVDKNAMAVWIPCPRRFRKPIMRKIGYLRDDIAYMRLMDIADGHYVFGEIKRVTGGTDDKPIYGVVLDVKVWMLDGDD